MYPCFLVTPRILTFLEQFPFQSQISFGDAIAIIGDIRQQLSQYYQLSFGFEDPMGQNGLLDLVMRPEVFFICDVKFSLTNELVLLDMIFKWRVFLSFFMTGETERDY